MPIYLSQFHSQVRRVLRSEIKGQNFGIYTPIKHNVLGDVDHGGSVGGGVGWLDFGVRPL